MTHNHHRVSKILFSPSDLCTISLSSLSNSNSTMILNKNSEVNKRLSFIQLLLPEILSLFVFLIATRHKTKVFRSNINLHGNKKIIKNSSHLTF